ncbi:MAG: bacteriocin-processing peptidase family protein [Gammaproteobacteria bacterium]|nr:MAG: bacteriocin-processing peptidase family protein [Gammaproteobacteria bacterium]
MLRLLIIATLLAGCAGARPLPELPETGVELTATPFHPQEQYQCGPAALATVLASSGVTVSPDALVDQVWLPGRHGSLQLEMVATTRSHGRVAYVLPPTLDAVVAELAQDRPVLVLQNLGTPRWPVWHFAVVIGFDPDRGRILLRSGTTERLDMSLRAFMLSWRMAESWALVPLTPGDLPAATDRQRYLAALADLERSGHFTAAAAGYRAWLEARPNDAVALFGMANSLAAAGESAAAEHTYRRLLEQRPGDAAASNNLARLLLARGCRRDAQDVLERVPASAPAPLQEALDATRREAGAATNDCL